MTQESSSSPDLSDLGFSSGATPAPTGAADFSDLGFQPTSMPEATATPAATPETDKAVGESIPPPVAAGFGGWLSSEIHKMDEWNRRNVPPPEMSNQEIAAAVETAKREHPFMFGAATAVAEAVPTTVGQLGMTLAGFAPITQGFQDISGAYQNVKKVAAGAPMSSFAGKPFNEFTTEDWGHFVGQMGIQAAMAIPMFRGLHATIRNQIIASAKEGTFKPPVRERDYIGGGETDASKVTSTESVPEHQVRPPVGEETPLRQPGETAQAGTQPRPAAESVATETPTANAPGVTEPGLTDRITNLRDEIAELRVNRKIVPIAKTQELQRLYAEQKTAEEGAVSQAPEPKQVAADYQQLQELRHEWAVLNNEGLQYVHRPNDRRALELEDLQNEANRRVRAQMAKLPDGDIIDTGIVGGGPAGVGAAINGPLENVDVTVYERQSQTGGASRFTSRLENVYGGPPIGESGKQLALNAYRKALRNGAIFERGLEITKAERDPNTGVWTLKTSGGQTYKHYSILANSGIKFRQPTFPGNEMVKVGNGEAMLSEAHGGPVAVVGGANSAAQAALAAAENGKGIVYMIVRSPRPEMSDYQARQVYANTKIEKIFGDEIERIEPGETPGGMKTVVTKKGQRIPVRSVGGFIGGTARTDWLPDYVKRDKRGFVFTDDKFRALDQDGKPIPGLFVAGTIRAGAENRVLASAAEGQRAITRAGEYIDALRDTGKFPIWKKNLKDSYNRSEWRIPPEELTSETTPTTAQPTGTQTIPSQTRTEPSLPAEKPTPKDVTRTTSKESSVPREPQTAAEAAAARVAAMPEGPAKRIAEERYDTMFRGGEVPKSPDKIIYDISSGDKLSLDPADEVALVDHRETLQNARDIAGQRAIDASLPKNERSNAAANFEDLNSQLEVMNQVTGDGRMFQSKSQALAWHQFRARDYSMPSMATKLQIAKDGAPLTKEETAKLKKGTDRLSDLMVKVGAAKAGALPGKVPPGLRDLQYEMHKTKIALDDMIFHEKFRQKPLPVRAWYTGRELLAVPRALMASMDLSAIRRQGGILFMSHPIRSLQIMPDMLRAMRSDKDYYSLMQDIRERPNAPMYLSSKLGLTEIKSPRLSDMEEMYLSRTADYIPGVSHSQRAYVYYLNRLRADTFDAMAKTLGRKGQITPKQADALSNFINVFTGRGTIPARAANAAVVLNDAFFAPRYVLSRFQVITGQPLRYAKDPMVRKMIAQEYGRALIGYGIMYGTVALAAEALGQKIEVSFDPRSTDFGKIKIGNTRIDPLSGLSQSIVFLTRMAPPITGKAQILGHTKTAAGMIQPVYGSGPLTQRKFGSVLQDFLRSKLAPLPSAYWNVAEQKKVTGEPTTISKELLGMITPMSGNDIYDAIKAHAVPAAAALGLIAIFGDSVNTYAKRGVAPNKVRPLKPSSGKKLTPLKPQ